MKRCLAILLALCLMMCGAGLSEVNVEELSQKFDTAYFMLSIPEDWEVDTEGVEAEDDYEYFGTLEAPGDEGMVIEAVMYYYENLKDVSLWDMDEEELQDYADALLADYSDDAPEYVSTLQAGLIPFIVIRMEDETGPYYSAETMTNGYVISFFAYEANTWEDETHDLTPEDWELFRAILMSFEPVR